MSKSAIYTANTSGQAIAVNSIIPVGNTIRRFGCNLRQDGNTIVTLGNGYYLVTVSATIVPTAAGTISVTAQKDGVAITGATGSETVSAVSTSVNICMSFVVRNDCGCDSSTLSFVLGGGDATISNFAVTVEKL